LNKYYTYTLIKSLLIKTIQDVVGEWHYFAEFLILKAIEDFNFMETLICSIATISATKVVKMARQNGHHRNGAKLKKLRFHKKIKYLGQMRRLNLF
jgi:hypothetical protein